MKKVLLLCASHNDLGLVWSLRKLGYYIISTGNSPGLIGEKYVDEYIKADYSDRELILSIAKNKGVDAICQCCNDFGVYTAAYVAEKLGLPGYDSYETTLTLHNKDKFKAFARKNNIISPVSECFDEMSKAEFYVNNSVVYPIIVKPVDCSAGNGIHRADTKEDAIKAIRQAFNNSREKRIVIEPYIEGTQHGFCTFIKDRKVVAYCSNNEYSFLNPYRVELDTFPADNNDICSPILINQIEKIAELLKLCDGIFHLQYIVDKKSTPQIIEVMRRTVGNMYWLPAGKVNGFDWNYWEVRARCGLSCEKIAKCTFQEGFYAYKAILAQKNGKIKAINIPCQYTKFLFDMILLKNVGDNITHYDSEPIGFLFFNFTTMRQMKDVLINNYDNSLVEIDEEK